MSKFQCDDCGVVIESEEMPGGWSFYVGINALTGKPGSWFFCEECDEFYNTSEEVPASRDNPVLEREGETK